MSRMDIFDVKINKDNHFQMRKRGFLVGVGVAHVKSKTYQERSFLMSTVQVRMRIPLVHPSKMHEMKGGDKRRRMKTLL